MIRDVSGQAAWQFIQLKRNEILPERFVSCDLSDPPAVENLDALLLKDLQASSFEHIVCNSLR